MLPMVANLGLRSKLSRLAPGATERHILRWEERTRRLGGLPEAWSRPLPHASHRRDCGEVAFDCDRFAARRPSR
jgi:hypothetical protein